MREILFRGKRLDNGEWAYGFLVKMFGAYHIIFVYDQFFPLIHPVSLFFMD